MRRTTVVLAVMALMALTAAPAAAGNGKGNSPIVPGAIYADGDLYGTRLLNELPYNGNDHSFDQLFLIDGQPPVAEAAPGNPAYNGGRWLPTLVDVTGDAPDDLLITSYEELMAAAAAGWVEIGAPDTAAAFLCPLIPNH